MSDYQHVSALLSQDQLGYEFQGSSDRPDCVRVHGSGEDSHGYTVHRQSIQMMDQHGSRPDLQKLACAGRTI